MMEGTSPGNAAVEPPSDTPPGHIGSAHRAAPGRLLIQAAFILLLGAYLLLAPLTRHPVDKDWSHLWLGGRMIVSGHAAGLYDPELQITVHREADPAGRPPAVWRRRNEILGCFNYPPPAAVAYAALAWLPLGTAAVVNAYLNIALALLAAWMLARTLDAGLSFYIAAIALLAYPPFFYNLSLGQNAIVATCVFVAAWRLCNGGRDFLAGLVLGLLICKPNWLLAVGWLPLVLGRGRLLAGLGCGAASVLLATLAITGPRPFYDYVQLFQKVAHLDELPGYALNLKYSAMGLFRKWLGAGSHTADLLGWTSGALVALATWRAARGGWRPGTPRFLRLLACWVMAALWINPHLNYYDLIPMAACVLALAPDWKTLGRVGRLTLLALAILSYAAVPWDRFWSLGFVLPVPSFAILALWAWFAWRLRADASVGYRPAAGCAGVSSRS